MKAIRAQNSVLRHAYNVRVPNPTDSGRWAAHAEAIGLIVIFAVILATVLLRWGRFVAWSVR